MAALPSLRQLSYLVTLSETLHFTEAARRSFVTQSTLSGGIMELERLLGGVLVERDRQNVRLTPLGEQVVARARNRRPAFSCESNHCTVHFVAAVR